jgi:adenine C2-methylase RlmN of 23S rRNA A2503 and tRNA A37
VSLALSLHAPTQELRRTIVPSARAYPLHKLMDAVAEYQAASQQRVFVEYVVLSGVNDAPEQAHELGQLLQVSPLLLVFCVLFTLALVVVCVCG